MPCDEVNLQYRPVRRNFYFFPPKRILIDVYAFSLMPVSRRQASMTEGIPNLCSRAMLICSIIWLGKRIAGCCSAGSVPR